MSCSTRDVYLAVGGALSALHFPEFCGNLVGRHVTALGCSHLSSEICSFGGI